MRYMPMAKVETGMTLGQDIYNGEGRLILGKRVILNHDNLQQLLKLGFPGIYIDDEFTEDLMIAQVIRPEVKREALKMVHDLFLDNKNLPTEQHNLQEVVMNVMEEVLRNEDVMCNMLDIKTYDDYVYFHSVKIKKEREIHLQIVTKHGFRIASYQRGPSGPVKKSVNSKK